MFTKSAAFYDAIYSFKDCQLLRRSAGVSLSVRIGLNSGEVVVGKIGDDLRGVSSRR